MYKVDAPEFPEFNDNEYSHVSSVRLSAFAGMQITRGPYGATSETRALNGETHARADKTLDPNTFIAAVEWVVAHDAAIRPKMFSALVEQYWEMRDLVIDSLVDEDPNDVVPEILEPDELAPLCGLVTLHIGNLNPSGEPIYGIELSCNWEIEHGAGVQFEGLNVVDVGDSSVAFLF